MATYPGNQPPPLGYLRLSEGHLINITEDTSFRFPHRKFQGVRSAVPGMGSNVISPCKSQSHRSCWERNALPTAPLKPWGLFCDFSKLSAAQSPKVTAHVSRVHPYRLARACFSAAGSGDKGAPRSARGFAWGERCARQRSFASRSLSVYSSHPDKRTRPSCFFTCRT